MEDAPKRLVIRQSQSKYLISTFILSSNTTDERSSSFLFLFLISPISLFIVEHIKAVLELSTMSEPNYLSTNTMKMCADALIKMILTEDVDVDFQKLLIKQAYILLVASTARNYLKRE